MAEINLEVGSAAYRFALHLLAKPADYGRHAISALLAVAPGAVDALLQPAVDMALVTIGANADQGGRVWRAGPRLAAWNATRGDKPVAMRPAVADTPPQQVKRGRGGPQPGLPALDLARVTVAVGAPLPSAHISKKGVTRYDALLDKLTADGMSVTGGISTRYQGALLKAVVVYLNNRPQLKATSRLYVRRLEANPQEIGVWRVALAGTDAMARSRKASA